MAWDDDKSSGDVLLSQDWDDMVSDQKGHASRHESGGADALTFSNLADVGITSITADTSSNLPAAGTSGRLFFETDTGRTLYDNGSSWVEVGLSESQISLGSLGSLDAGGNTLTNLGSPSNNSDAVTKQYADALEQGLVIKDSVRVASQADVDLSSSTDPNPVDGVTLSDGDRVLLKDQTAASENGVYVANTASDPSTWTRSSDADEDSEVTSGMFTFVEEGVESGNESYILITDDPITVGSTALDFTVFSRAGEVVGGDGLVKSGNTLDVRLDVDDDGVDVTDAYGIDFGGSHFDVTDDTDNTVTVSLTNDSVSVAGNSVSLGGSTSVSIDDLSDVASSTESAGQTLIWDATNSEFVNAAITTGDGLKSTSSDGSFTVNIEPADFAGSFLSDDGSDDLEVNLGDGVEGDGSDNIRVDEDFDFTFTSAIDFNSGLDTSGDITDGSTVIWDTSAGEIPDSAMGTIDNATLDNSSVTVAGNSVSLGGSASVEVNDLTDVDVEAINADTSGNLPAAGTSGRIFFETDTGRTLYDNGTSWVEVGLSESQISLANLSSRSHSDLSDAPSSAHHTRPSAGTALSEDGSNNFNFSQTLSENGSNVITGPTDINFTASTDASVSVTDDADGTATVDIDVDNTTTNVSAAGSQIVSEVSDINFTSSNDATVTVSDDNDGTATVNVSATDTTYGAGDGINLVTNTFSLDEGYSPTWTSSHTFNGGMTVGSNVSSGTAGSNNVGTSTNYFNEMHATSFITHSPEARTADEAMRSLMDWEEGSMEMEEKLADAITVIKEQQKQIEDLKNNTDNKDQKTFKSIITNIVRRLF